MAKQILTLEQFKQILSYDPEDGTFTWLVNRHSRVRIGQAVGSPVGKRGYLSTRIAGRNYYLHRIAWLWMTGQWPRATVDHIDGNRGNNRFKNLRDVSQAAQRQNIYRSMRKDGLLGAHYDARDKVWVAQISVSGCYKRLGSFSTEKEAHAVYIAAKRKLHPFGNL
jgi:hypothetical protein